MDPLDEMIANWRRRSAERRARGTERAERLRSHLPAAKKLLHERHGARRVFVFGSLARGDTTESSDVDLAVLGLEGTGYFAAIAELQGLFDAPVDLVELETASESMRKRVEIEGIEL